MKKERILLVILVITMFLMAFGFLPKNIVENQSFEKLSAIGFGLFCLIVFFIPFDLIAQTGIIFDAEEYSAKIKIILYLVTLSLSIFLFAGIDYFFDILTFHPADYHQAAPSEMKKTMHQVFVQEFRLGVISTAISVFGISFLVRILIKIRETAR
jgi:hypothetical protein